MRIIFPTTPDVFIADQEDIVGRELSKGEKEVVAALGGGVQSYL